MAVRGFDIGWRNPGHWDIVTDEGRVFAIRGEPGDVVVRDERRDGFTRVVRPPLHFKSVSIAMAWCADELMAEKSDPQP